MVHKPHPEPDSTVKIQNPSKCLWIHFQLFNINHSLHRIKSYICCAIRVLFLILFSPPICWVFCILSISQWFWRLWPRCWKAPPPALSSWRYDAFSCPIWSNSSATAEKTDGEPITDTSKPKYVYRQTRIHFDKHVWFVHLTLHAYSYAATTVFSQVVPKHPKYLASPSQ